MSYSSDGYVPGSCAVVPSTSSLTKPTGACGIVNCPWLSVSTATAAWTTVRFECSTLVRTARTVTPGMGTLLLSSTTPEIDVAAGGPGARPDAVNAAAKPTLVPKSASTRLLALPSCRPSVRVAAARPSESVTTVIAG